MIIISFFNILFNSNFIIKIIFYVKFYRLVQLSKKQHNVLRIAKTKSTKSYLVKLTRIVGLFYIGFGIDKLVVIF
jgi:hypothetical protein